MHPLLFGFVRAAVEYAEYDDDDEDVELESTRENVEKVKLGDRP